MKHFVAALLVALFAQGSADALPGDPYPQVVNWVQNHKFLSPWLLGPAPDAHSIEYMYTAFRQLQDNWFIDIKLSFGGTSDKSQISQQKEGYAQLTLLKKSYDPTVNTDNAWDSRPWKDVDCKDIWKRDNPTAEQLLTQIYGASIANDFKSAKMAFKNRFYIASTIGSGHTDILFSSPGAETPQDVNQWGMHQVNKGDVEILLGKRYGYIVQQGAEEDTDDPIALIYTCPSMGIVSVKHATQSSNALSHNYKLYQQWQKQQEAKTKRLEPASIKID